MRYGGLTVLAFGIRVSPLGDSPDSDGLPFLASIPVVGVRGTERADAGP